MAFPRGSLRASLSALLLLAACAPDSPRQELHAQTRAASSDCVVLDSVRYCAADGDTVVEASEYQLAVSHPGDDGIATVHGDFLGEATNWDLELPEWSLKEEFQEGRLLEVQVLGSVEEESVRSVVWLEASRSEGWTRLRTELPAFHASFMVELYSRGALVDSRELETLELVGKGVPYNHLSISPAGVTYSWSQGAAFQLKDGEAIDRIRIIASKTLTRLGLKKVVLDGWIGQVAPWKLLDVTAFACLSPGWDGHLGGLFDDRIHGTASTNWRGVPDSTFITGSFVGWNSAYPAKFDTEVRTSIDGSTDAFVAKIDRCNNIEWIRRIGGKGDDSGRAVAVAPDGSVYAVGRFEDQATIEGTPQVLNSQGGADVYLIKYDASGKFVFALSAGGAGQDLPLGVTLQVESLDPGSLGKLLGAYVVGQTDGSATFGGLVTPPSNGKADGFVARVDLNAQTWSSVEQLGGPDDDRANGVAVMLNGDACVVGDFTGWLRFGGGQVLKGAGRSDGFLALYNPSGALVWPVTLGDEGDETAKAVAAAWDGSVFPHPTGNEVAWRPETYGVLRQGCVVVGEFTDTFTPPLGVSGVSSLGGTDVYFARFMADLKAPSFYSRESTGAMGGFGVDVVHGVSVANRSVGSAAIAGAFQEQADFSFIRRTGLGKLEGFVAEYPMEYYSNQDPTSVISFGGLADDEAWGVSQSSVRSSALSWGGSFDSNMRIHSDFIKGEGSHDGFFRAQ